jgi:hypothetical protein
MVGDRVRDIATGEVFTIYKIAPWGKREGSYLERNFYYIQPAPDGTIWYLTAADFNGKYIYEPS